MEPFIEKIAEFCDAIYSAVKRRANKPVFIVTTCGSFIYGWNLANFWVSDFWLKAIASLLGLFIGAPIATFLKEFMHDLYQIKIKPRIFKDKK